MLMVLVLYVVLYNGEALLSKEKINHLSLERYLNEIKDKMKLFQWHKEFSIINLSYLLFNEHNKDYAINGINDIFAQ